MRLTFVRAISAYLSILVCSTAPAFSQSGAFGALPVGSQHVRSENITLAGSRAGGSDLFVPMSGLFKLEYAVRGGKQVLITMLTQAQYQEIAAGRKPTGVPLIRAVVTGSGVQSAQILRGNYFIAFNNKESSNTSLSYRASFVPQ